MKPMIAIIVSVAIVFLVGTGFQRTTSAWAGQGSGHDHSSGADAAAPSGAAQGTPSSSPQQAMKMQHDMMARMSASDEQIKTLRSEMNNAQGLDARVAVMTKLLNIMLDERSLMRTQMELHGSMMEQMMSTHQMGMPKAPSSAPKP